MTTSIQSPLAAAPAKTTTTPEKQELPVQPEEVTMKGSPDTSIFDSDTAFSPSIAFVPEACLFCPQVSSDFDASLIHMQKSHGLFIPASIDDGALHLAVDKDTLVGYMHLVIFDYHECLFCGTQKATGWAARQHMTGRGHCRIDLDGLESEWRDFYESDDDLNSENGLENEDDAERVVQDEANISTRGRHPVHINNEGQTPTIRDGDSLRLTSGKTVAHRAAPAPKNPNRKPLAGEKGKQSPRGLERIVLEDFSTIREHPSTAGSFETNAADPFSNPDAAPQASSSRPPSQPQALSRTDRRLLASNKSAVTSAVATMSKHDRAALMHLSPAQRRALVVGQFKQQEQAHTAERKYWSKFERRQDQPAVGGKVYIGGG